MWRNGGKLHVHVAGRAAENFEWPGGAENFEWPGGTENVTWLGGRRKTLSGWAGWRKTSSGRSENCVAGAARELRVAGDGGNRMGAGRRKTSRRRRKGGSPGPIGHTASYVLISTLPRERAHLRSQRGRGRLQRAAPRARGSQHCNKRNKGFE